MSTYSINISTSTESAFTGILSPNNFLSLIPDNTSQLVTPKDVRDGLFTIWDNIAFKQVSITASNLNYIGLGGTNYTERYSKIFIGKPTLDDEYIMSSDLLSYDNSDINIPDSDVYFYNFKPDNFGTTASDQFTKVSFLAGDAKALFPTAPFLMSQQVGTSSDTRLDFTIKNIAGKLIIDSDDIQIGNSNTKMSFLYSATGSTGIGTKPTGSINDLQINLDNCDFGFIPGSTASVGDILLMGVGNVPYWGQLNGDNVYTLNQILSSGNTSFGEDLVLSANDKIYLSGTNSTSIYDNGTQSFIDADVRKLDIKAGTLKLDITGIGANKTLLSDASGNAYWGARTNTLSSILTSSNQTSGNNILINQGDVLQFTTGTGSMQLYVDSNKDYITSAREIVLDPDTLKILVDGHGANRMFYTNGDGNSYWGSYPTLAMSLSVGNETTNNDLIISQGDNLVFGSSATMSLSGSTMSMDFSSDVRIKLDGAYGVNKALLSDGDGKLYWGNSSASINIAGTTSNVQFNDGGVLGATSSFVFDTTFSTLGVNANVISASASLVIGANNSGSVYIDVSDKENAIMYGDNGDISYHLDALNKVMYNDKLGYYKTTFGTDTPRSKFTFKDSTGGNGISFVPQSSSSEFKINYVTTAGATTSIVSFSPNAGGMFIGVGETTNRPVYIGDYGTGYSANIVSYPQVYPFANVGRNTTKGVVIGNAAKTSIIPGGQSNDTDARALGINIVPEADLHLNGMMAITPEIIDLSPYISTAGNYKSIGGIKSSYLLVDDDVYQDNFIGRIGDKSIAGTKAAPFGTTLEIWNRTGGSLSFALINTHLPNGTYDSSNATNIYDPYSINGTATISINTGESIRFVYLPIGGDLNANLLNVTNKDNLIAEEGVWYKVR